jgi:hypothetical protein
MVLVIQQGVKPMREAAEGKLKGIEAALPTGLKPRYYSKSAMHLTVECQLLSAYPGFMIWSIAQNEQPVWPGPHGRGVGV